MAHTSSPAHLHVPGHELPGPPPVRLLAERGAREPVLGEHHDVRPGLARSRQELQVAVCVVGDNLNNVVYLRYVQYLATLVV